MVFVLIVGLSWTGSLSAYAQLVIMFIGVNIIMSASLNLVNGYMGEFSCGHAGFMAIGAYTPPCSRFGSSLRGPFSAPTYFPRGGRSGFSPSSFSPAGS